MKNTVEYMTTREVAQFIGLTAKRVSSICAESKIAGAFKMGHTWLIPKSAVLIDYDDNRFACYRARRTDAKSL